MLLDIDEADKVLGNNSDTICRGWIQILLGMKPMKVGPQQWANFKAFNGCRLPPPTHVLLVTATEHDMAVELQQKWHIDIRRIQLPLHPDYLGHKDDFHLLDNILVKELPQERKFDRLLFKAYDHAAEHPYSMLLNVTNHRVTGENSIYHLDSELSTAYPDMATVIIAKDAIHMHGPGSGGNYATFPEHQLSDVMYKAHELAGPKPLHVLLSPAKTMRALSLLVTQGDVIHRRITHGVFKIGQGHAAGDFVNIVKEDL